LTQTKSQKSKQKLERGLVSIFTGQGKGKTTAAIGTAVRAAGHGLKVHVIFFLKGSTYEHGEFKILSEIPGVTISSFGKKGWIRENDTSSEHRQQAQLAFEEARKTVIGGEYDLVILDEINIALSFGLIELEQVIKLIEDKPSHVELILTGNDADPRLVMMADLVSEILAIKHPFTEGIKARKGIDY